jgi:serine/threonine-protein kinase
MNERYDFIKQYPAGGFGNVVALFDKQLKREVVVKTLIYPTNENYTRLMREGRILNQLLAHEHVIDLIAVNNNPTTPCLVLEHCKHGNLQDWVAYGNSWLGRNWWDNACAIQHAALGLSAIHALGGFHRDIKPSNLFIGENKQGQRVIKLGDFGFGRLPHPFTKGNITRHACGTEGYIAPELYRPGATYTMACDIFSLGITGLEISTGSKSRAAITNAFAVPEEFRNLLLEMTSQNPQERPNAQMVAFRISQILEAQKVSANTGFGIVATLVCIGLLL